MSFPSYEALKWQIWKCELGWFSLGQSHILYTPLCSIIQNNLSGGEVAAIVVSALIAGAILSKEI